MHHYVYNYMYFLRHNMEKHTRLNITLPESLANELNQMAKELPDKKSRIITKALELYFDELDGFIAEKRLAELQNGKITTTPAEEVWAELGL